LIKERKHWDGKAFGDAPSWLKTDGPDRYTGSVDFRTQLLSTLKAIQSVLNVPGVMVIGSEVPNLLQPEVASTLVVSQDVDIGVPIGSIEEVKAALRDVVELEPSEEEPSVWLPSRPGLIEVNFVGMDPDAEDLADAYVVDDVGLPRLVFGALSLLRKGKDVAIEDFQIPVPRPTGLLLEKLLTERVGEKGERDLLVVAGLLEIMKEADFQELEVEFFKLPVALRYAVSSNLTILSLMRPGIGGMPDPRPQRARIAKLLNRFEGLEAEGK